MNLDIRYLPRRTYHSVKTNMSVLSGGQNDVIVTLFLKYWKLTVSLALLVACQPTYQSGCSSTAHLNGFQNCLAIGHYYCEFSLPADLALKSSLCHLVWQTLI